MCSPALIDINNKKIKYLYNYKGCKFRYKYKKIMLLCSPALINIDIKAVSYKNCKF